MYEVCLLFINVKCIFGNSVVVFVVMMAKYDHMDR